MDVRFPFKMAEEIDFIGYKISFVRFKEKINLSYLNYQETTYLNFNEFFANGVLSETRKILE